MRRSRRRSAGCKGSGRESNCQCAHDGYGNCALYRSAGKPSFELGENEVEIGMGIHGEPGTHREEIRTVKETTDTLLEKIFAEGIYQEGDEVAVMVNGLGGTPLQELYLANLRVSEVLAEKNIKVAKTLVGNFMTSIDMAGYSVTLLKLDDELKKYLAAPADTPAFVQV